ncbi:MAG: DUF4235 domain-containing protein [Gemmatimonadota bacterium]
MIRTKTAWLIVGSGAAALGGFAVRRSLEEAWKLAKHEDPPLDPSSWDVEWKDAIIWTVATGVAMGLGRLLARRGAAAGWERLTGSAPPG